MPMHKDCQGIASRLWTLSYLAYYGRIGASLEESDETVRLFYGTINLRPI